MNPFSQINQIGIACIDQNKVTLTKERSEFVYRQGEMPKGIYFLKTGLVGLVSVGISGKEHLLRMFKPGQYFGHRSFFAKEPYHASSICLDHCEVEFVAEACIYRLLEVQPELHMNVIQTLARELRDSEEIRISFSEKDVLARTAEALIYLEKVSTDHRWTRKELADLLGSTPPTIVRTLQKLETMGLLEQQGKDYEIINYNGLLEAAERTRGDQLS